jgi:hypothetical protein
VRTETGVGDSGAFGLQRRAFEPSTGLTSVRKRTHPETDPGHSLLRNQSGLCRNLSAESGWATVVCWSGGLALIRVVQGSIPGVRGFSSACPSHTHPRMTSSTTHHHCGTCNCRSPGAHPPYGSPVVLVCLWIWCSRVCIIWRRRSSTWARSDVHGGVGGCPPPGDAI